MEKNKINKKLNSKKLKKQRLDFSSIQQTNYDAKKEIPNNLFQENTKEGLNHDSQFFSSKRMGLSEEPEDEEKGLISKDFIMQLEEEIEEENQIVQTKIEINGDSFSIFYIESLINKTLYSSSVLLPIEKLKKDLTKSKENLGSQNVNSLSVNKNNDIFEMVKNCLSISSVKTVNDINEIENNIFSGFTVIVFKDKALACPLLGIEKRGIAEPPSSKVIKGPREGFVEDIGTNNGLVRKRLKTKDLKIINLFVGTKSKTMISIYYLEDVAKPEIVEKVKKIINSINIDSIIDSYYLVSFLEGDKYKFFKRVGNTEKPDVFCSKILEGRVGILVDGSPMALTVPFILIEDLQSAGDYYTIPAFATFTRIMRFLGLIIAIIAPGVYVSLQSYNYNILPINFLITLLSSIEGLSVPPLLEILLVLFLFEVITEASVRMPSAMGMALSIIGALALGNTAVDAGIISPPSIVIVAISSVSIHIIPDQFDQMRILRMLFTIIGGIIGLYGIYVGTIFLITYMCSVESFGIPYLVPYSPTVQSDKKDGFIMQPIQKMQYRPMYMAGKDKIRQGKNK